LLPTDFVFPEAYESSFFLPSSSFTPPFPPLEAGEVAIGFFFILPDPLPYKVWLSPPFALAGS